MQCMIITEDYNTLTLAVLQVTAPLFSDETDSAPGCGAIWLYVAGMTGDGGYSVVYVAVVRGLQPTVDVCR